MDDVIVRFCLQHFVALLLGWIVWNALIGGLIEPDKTDSKFYWWFYGFSHGLCAPVTMKLWKRIMFLRALLELNGVDVGNEKFARKVATEFSGGARPL